MSERARNSLAVEQPDVVRAKESWQRFRAMMAASYIEPYRVLYVQTRNPTHALEAYRIARVFKIDVPGWILELFDQWAEALCVKRPKGAKTIADALGLGTKGGPSITSQANTQIRNLRIAQRVLELRDLTPERDTLDVFDQVAEEFAPLSSERVAGIWYELTRDVKL
jgi:hypothetical protein